MNLTTDFIRVYEAMIPESLQLATFSTLRDVIKMRTDSTVRSIAFNQHVQIQGLESLYQEIAKIAYVRYMSDCKVNIFPKDISFEGFRATFFESSEVPPTNDDIMRLVTVDGIKTASRFLSVFMMPLDSNGGIFFPGNNLSVPAKAGRVVVFPATWMIPVWQVPPQDKTDCIIINTFIHYPNENDA